jgi:signal transduction histidine kinase
MPTPVTRSGKPSRAAQRRAARAGRRAAGRPRRFRVRGWARRIGPRLDPRSVEELGRLGPLATWLRWACLIFGVALGLTTEQPDRTAFYLAGAVLLANTVFRTVRPIQIYPATWRAEAVVVIDLMVAVGSIAFTGTWSSPYLLMPIPVVLLAAYGWGYREGFFAFAFTVGTIFMADAIDGATQDALRTGALASIVVVTAAIVGGYTRQLWLEAEERERETADEVGRMALANDLFHALHDVVRTLPDSLDLAEVVASARDTLRDVFAPDVLVVLLADETSASWRTQLAEGRAIPEHLETDDLPSKVREALERPGVVRVQSTATQSELWNGEFASSGMIVGLRTPDRVVGLVAVEHRAPDRITGNDAELFARIASSLALAVDNARWFGRLRTLGAEAERARIARDLHDRTAQSLAYIGFELDRLSNRYTDPALPELHRVVREVVVELRETLYQLRTTVTEEEGFVPLAEPYLKRWSGRTGINANFEAIRPDRRLPRQVEQELWRIFQEALTNVERHADASTVHVTWDCSDRNARLVVSDDGAGMDPSRPNPERYGLVGIRERADAIGARVRFESTLGSGTSVHIELEATP